MPPSGVKPAIATLQRPRRPGINEALTSEQRPLHAQRFRLDRLLIEKPLHRACAGRAVTGEVIVEEAVDLFRMRRDLQHLGPTADLLRTIELHMRIVRDLP